MEAKVDGFEGSDYLTLILAQLEKISLSRKGSKIESEVLFHCLNIAVTLLHREIEEVRRLVDSNGRDSADKLVRLDAGLTALSTLTSGAEGRLTESQARLGTQLTDVKGELETQIADVKSDLETQLTEVKDELSEVRKKLDPMADMIARLDEREKNNKWWVLAFIAFAGVVGGLLAKLFP